MAVLTEDTQRKVEDRLVEVGALTPEQLDTIKDGAKQAGRPVFAYAIDRGVINEEQLTEAIAKISGTPYVNLSKAVIDAKVLALLPMEVARRFMAVPLGETSDGGAQRLAVAMLDATNIQAVDFLSRAIERPIKVYIASESGINNVISQYHIDMDSVDSVLSGSSSEAIKSVETKNADGEVIEIAPEIPFSEFPAGPREAGPDAEGRLVWRVNVTD